MKSWPEWLALWKQLSVDVPCPQFTKETEWKLVVLAIEAAETRLRRKVDAACRTWIRTGRWPRVSGPVRWFILWRTVKAMRACIVLMTPGPDGFEAVTPAATLTEEDLKHWFLIDLWTWGWNELQEELRHGEAVPNAKFAVGRN